MGHQKMSPELMRCRVYSIVVLQLVLTIFVAAFSASSYHPIFAPLIGGFNCFLLPSLTAIFAIYPLYCYRHRHPVNYVLLVLFTVSMAFVVGFSCAVLASHKEQVFILEAGILTTLLVASLTLFTSWAANRGYDFNFLGLLWSGSVLVFVLFGIIQIFFPLGETSFMIWGCIYAIIFCIGVLFNAIDDVIAGFTYDEYVWAAWVCMVTSSFTPGVLLQLISLHD